jgi:hypothetical protein
MGLLKSRILTQYADLSTLNGTSLSAIEDAYGAAIACARSQANKFDELRATTRFGRWLKTQGRVVEARTMLSDIYSWFTEGFDTVVLKEAQVLLEELMS